jgi:hypothetical protein
MSKKNVHSISSTIRSAVGLVGFAAPPIRYASGRFGEAHQADHDSTTNRAKSKTFTLGARQAPLLQVVAASPRGQAMCPSPSLQNKTKKTVPNKLPFLSQNKIPLTINQPPSPTNRHPLVSFVFDSQVSFHSARGEAAAQH